MKKAISSIRHIRNIYTIPQKSYFFAQHTSTKNWVCAIIVIIIPFLLYQCILWMYCYYGDKKFTSIHNCYNLCSWEIGHISRKPIQTPFYYCHYWTKNRLDRKRLYINDHFLFFFDVLLCNTLCLRIWVAWSCILAQMNNMTQNKHAHMVAMVIKDK